MSGTGAATNPAAHYHPGFNCDPDEFEVTTTSNWGMTNLPFTIVVP